MIGVEPDAADCELRSHVVGRLRDQWIVGGPEVEAALSNGERVVDIPVQLRILLEVRKIRRA